MMRFFNKKMAIFVITFVLGVTFTKNIYIILTILFTNPIPGKEPKDVFEWTDSNFDIYTHPNEQRTGAKSFETFPGGQIPNVVHFLWCQRKPLEFQHYISILSVLRFLRPASVEFHHAHDILFLLDRYNLWLEDLQDKIPGFVTRKIDSVHSKCGVSFIIAVLHSRGGIYISEGLMLLKPLQHFRNSNFTFGISKHISDIAFIFAKPREVRLVEARRLLYSRELEIDSFTDTIICDIVQPNRLLGTNEDSLCAVLPNVSHSDILLSNAHVARLSREMLYGSPEPVVAMSILPGTIPKFVHLVLCYKKILNFKTFLSLRSLLTILKPVKVFIHGTNLPEGEYFANFSRDPRIVHKFSSCGNESVVSQKSLDTLKADALLKYGGIYMDWGVIWLKPIDDILTLGYDTILNFDHVIRTGYPGVLNMDIILAKPNSHFIQTWKSSIQFYSNTDRYYNIYDIPYKLYEKYTNHIYIERHLDVKCIMLGCFPKFAVSRQNINNEIPFDWRKDTYAIRISGPNPMSFINRTVLESTYDQFASMGKYILRQEYDYDKQQV